MPRGYRCIIAAAVGWLVLSAAGEPQNRTEPEQTRAQQAAAQALSNIAATYDRQAKDAEKSHDKDPCESGHDKRNSDLCAQWKAADSASLAAWLSGIGLIGVAIALALNAHSNWIASRTAKRQLRPYLSIKWAGYYGISNDGHSATYSLVFVNSGQTPAYNYRAYIACYIAEDRHMPKPAAPFMLGKRLDIVGPGQERGDFNTPMTITPELRAAKLGGTHRVYMTFTAEFSDSFGHRYWIENAFRSVSEMPINMEVLYAREMRLPRWEWRFWRKKPGSEKAGKK
jgi:hypothetical protein